MITRTRARRNLSEVMAKHKIRFTDAAITDMVNAICGDAISMTPPAQEIAGAWRMFCADGVNGDGSHVVLFSAADRVSFEAVADANFTSLECLEVWRHLRGKWAQQSIRVKPEHVITHGYQYFAEKKKSQVSYGTVHE